MVKIIFLDIDGVINRCTVQQEDISHNVANRKAKTQEEYSKYCDLATVEMFDQPSLCNLDRLIAQGAKVVLSSSWKTRGDISYLQELFAYHNFSRHLIDKTTSTSFGKHTRDLQIKTWLDQHPVDTFVILDDQDEGFTSMFPHNFVQTTRYDLFNEEAYSQASKILFG